MTKSRSHKRSRAAWKSLIDRFQSSDQTIKQFCAEHGLNRHTFQYWRTKMKKEALDSPGFVSIQTKPESRPESIILRQGSFELILPPNYPVSGLIELMNGLSC